MILLQEQISRHLALAMYATAAPLNLVENLYWKKFFAVIRPSFRPPNRQMMSHALLEQVHFETSVKVKELVAAAPSLTVT